MPPLGAIDQAATLILVDILKLLEDDKYLDVFEEIVTETHSPTSFDDKDLDAFYQKCDEVMCKVVRRVARAMLELHEGNSLKNRPQDRVAAAALLAISGDSAQT